MDTDLLFVLGAALGVLVIPAILSALIDGRAPRTPALLLIIGGLMMGYAVLDKPGTYSILTLPDTLIKVIGRYTN